MGLENDKIEIQRRLSHKGQLTLPGEVRKALGLRPGDSVTFEIAPDGTVTILRSEPLDPFFHLPIFQALEEWSADQTNSSFSFPQTTSSSSTTPARGSGSCCRKGPTSTPS